MNNRFSFQSGRSNPFFLLGFSALVFILSGCSNPDANKPANKTAPSVSHANSQRVYLDPQTGNMRAPTIEEKEAENRANNKTDKPTPSPQTDNPHQTKFNKGQRVEKIPGGGAVLHFSPDDWSKERVTLPHSSQPPSQKGDAK